MLGPDVESMKQKTMNEEADDRTRVGGVPEGEHGDLPHPAPDLRVGCPRCRRSFFNVTADGFVLRNWAARPECDECAAVVPNAHTLTLEFGRFLDETEWRIVIEQVKALVPYVQHLRADAVQAHK